MSFWSVQRILAGTFLLVLQVWQACLAFPHQATLRDELPKADSTRQNYVGDQACRPCHSQKVASYLGTTHHRTSQLPTTESILGSFAEDKNILKTSDPALYFRMESKPDGFYQTAVWGIPPATGSHSEKIDVVIGSGKKGQTYLYWKRDQLFQLPVSYWTTLLTWINSPGYRDGEVNFERSVIPNCLGCHLAYALAIGSPILSNQFKPESLVMGISCERCHGAGRLHVEAKRATKQVNIINPARLSRDGQINVCAQCHGGVRAPLVDPFSYVPGESLDKYFRIDDANPVKTADVHGNQVALLQMSRCYQSSEKMTCSTCHDVHETQQDLEAFSKRCLNCHQAEDCGEFHKSGEKFLGNCLNCHMPVQASNLIISNWNGKKTRAMVRSHWIKIYAGSSQDSAPSPP
jgi:ssDNA-binding Zn-finger/Zn-ribbon topoisomerase 1